MENIKFNAEKWMTITGIVILDADGWDRKGDFNADWDKEISFDDFYDKACRSTTSGLKLDYDELKAMVFDKIHRGEIPNQ